MFGSILYLLEEIKIKNVIIGKQYSNCENLQKFLKIIKEKNIKVNIVEGESKIKIENNLYFDVLWPNDTDIVFKNSINNNALVCKLNYKNFSMLFTGDIEQEAENKIVFKYKNTKILNSTIIKVAHHGSKSSSTEDFLKLVQPQIALIGVGANNIFGHPNSEIIKRLENYNVKVYRTDEMGEIEMNVNSKGKIKIDKKLSN